MHLIQVALSHVKVRSELKLNCVMHLRWKLN
jgi:hypothetical protein